MGPAVPIAMAAAVLLAGCSGGDDAVGSVATVAVEETSTTVAVEETTTVPSTTLAPTTTVLEQRTIKGAFTLTDGDFDIYQHWTKCSGSGGYDDFGPGMNVVVKGADGSVTGAGSTEALSALDLTDDDDWLSAVADDASAANESAYLTSCTVIFEVEVGDDDFYSVAVGGRGEQTYSKADLEANDWTVELALG